VREVFQLEREKGRKKWMIIGWTGDGRKIPEKEGN
jgi:hypothetical protein